MRITILVKDLLLHRFVTTIIAATLVSLVVSPVARADNLNGTEAPTTQIPDAAWRPPGVGIDGEDWVQLKSGEWLRGQLKYIQNKDVEFDSDELDEMTIKLKDVRSVYTAHPVYTQFDRRQPVYGTVVIDGDVVTVNGAVPLSLKRNQLIGITPKGDITGMRIWSGYANIGFSTQSGNSSQTTVSTSAELARRTPNTTLLFDYLGNYSKANGTENSNNDRLDMTYDIRINRDWFVRPMQAEYYQDPLSNISYRVSVGAGGGYYIYDISGLEWKISTGPGYQYQKFRTVEVGQSDTATTPQWLLESKYKLDITDRLTFRQTWQSYFMSSESGRYSQHTVTTLEFEIKRHLNLDVSFIWDFLQNPQPKSDGSVPARNDRYLTVGLGVRF